MTTPETDRASSLRRKRVLLVDDDDFAREFAEAVLNEAGAEVSVAAHPDEALCVAARLPFDVAVLDLNMPDRSGWEVMELLRDLHSGVRIVVLSGYVDEGLRQRCRPDAVVWKPYRGHQLVAAVRGVD